MNKLSASYEAASATTNLILEALATLKQKVSLESRLLELEPASSTPYRADASIDLIYEGGSTFYLVECKSTIDRKTQIDQVRRQLESTGSPGLLITPHLTKELADHCRATGLQFVDTSGNAYLHARGLFVLITGEKGERRHQSQSQPKGLTSAAALRVVFAVLARPELVTAPLKDIASHAGVSLGSAYNALDDLEARGFLVNKKNAERRKLLERDRLVDEWAINYPTTLRAKLNRRRFSSPDSAWWQHKDLDGVDCVWGSEVAAMKMTSYLKPSTQTLYVPSSAMDRVISTLAKRYRIRPDDNGDIEILEKFWHWQTNDSTAPPLLVYSELLALLDPRAQETAHMIRERYIDTALDTA